MTAYGGCECRAARGLMGGEWLRARATHTICQGHETPNEGGVDLETEKCIKTTIMKMLNIFPWQKQFNCMALLTTVNNHISAVSMIPIPSLQKHTVQKGE